jgi:DNA adenine methylase
LKAIVRWAGSKRQLLPKLIEFWPKEGSRYIEPFCGSACLFFALQPAAAILGDLNSELIDAYRALQEHPVAVVNRLKRMKRGKREYYRVRAQSPEELEPQDRAARFLYLNRHCFNGIFRTNTAGKFNVPYGPQRKNTPIDEKTLKQSAALLRRATLIAGSFTETLSRVRRGDFVYLDPPYVVERRRVFREYHPDSFGADELETLASWLRRLDRVGAHFVVSYGDSREARELLEGWNPRRVRTRRNVAGFAGDRRHAYELLASNLAN